MLDFEEGRYEKAGGFDMWILIIERISWTDKKINEEVLGMAGE